MIFQRDDNPLYLDLERRMLVDEYNYLIKRLKVVYVSLKEVDEKIKDAEDSFDSFIKKMIKESKKTKGKKNDRTKL